MRLRSAVLTRLVAVALLLWAATDLALPQLCSEDSSATSQSAQGSSTDSSRPDDCFCCCHHIFPVNVHFAIVLVRTVDLPVVQPVSSLHGIVRTVFRPPVTI